jgi:hypothetical protein
MARRIVLVVGAVLALACAGTALYASGQPAEFKCLANKGLHPGDPGYRPVPGDAEYRRPAGVSRDHAELDAILDRHENVVGGPCVRSEDAPLAILRSGAERWWWFGAVAVVVLTLLIHPVSSWEGWSRM